jgi:hypothetical protein
MRSTSKVVGLVLIGAIFLAVGGAPPAAAGRLSDKEVADLVKEIGRDLKRFTQAIPAEYRKAVIRGAQGEVDVSAFLADMAKNRDAIESRLRSNYAASAEAGVFLLQARRVQDRLEAGKGLFGAETAWQTLGPRLEKLAGAYGVDWNSEVGQWNPRRMSDGELQTTLTEMEKELKAFSKGFGADLKADKALSSYGRKEILAEVNALQGLVTETRKSFNKKVNIDIPVQQILDKALELETETGSRTLSADTSASWQELRKDLATLRAGFGI